MRTYRDAKAMAKSLKAALGERAIALSHGDCLELVATQFGAKSWNVLASEIAGDTQTSKSATANGQAGPVLRSAIPILRIFSVEKAKEFYVEFLGFRIEWEHRFSDDAPLYAEITRGEVKLHLSEHHGDASPGATVLIWMRGLDAFHRELHAKAYRYNRPGVEQMPWNARQMQVPDPFGNRLRFSEPVT